MARVRKASDLRPEPKAPREAAEERLPHGGQTLVAYRFEKENKGKFLHVRGVGWHRWNGQFWEFDERGFTHRALLKTLRRTMGAGFTDDKLMSAAKSCQSSSAQEGILKIASNLEGFAKVLRDMDPDPYLLNVQNGIFDLRSFEMLDHDPKHLITKICNAHYDPSAVGMNWQKFLGSAIPDVEIQEFLQRYIGYSLKGVVEEHVLPIFIGRGRNGKGTFYETVLHALGGYAYHADSGLLMRRRSENLSGLMELQGRRFVSVSETERDEPMAESTMKMLTGGDPITARRLFKERVTFLPTHSIILVTNHFPKVDGNDDAVWDRLVAVPWDQRFIGKRRDKGMKENLKLEIDAVLLWAIEGLREYEELGDLAVPDVIRQRTGKFRVDSDEIRTWFASNCVEDPNAKVLLKDFHEAYTMGPHIKNQPQLSAVKFREELESRGFQTKKTNGARWYLFGWRLLEPDEEA